MIGRPTTASISVFVATIFCSCSSSCGGGKSANDAAAPSLKPWDVCTTGWPAAPAAQSIKPPLSVTPSLLWVKDLGHGGLGLGGVALAGDRLAVPTGNQVQMVSRSGDILATYTDPRFEVHSPPTADAAGNVYVLTQSGIHSIDNGGNPRWHAYAFRARPNDPELVTLPPPLLGPDGGVYAAGLYPELIAVDSANGNERFRVADGGSPIAGAASLLFVSGSPSTRVIDLTTHAFAGQLDPGSGQATVLGSPFGSTGLAWGVLGFEYGVIAVTSNGYVVFGTCGKSPWTFRDGWPEFASLIGADERLITVTWDENVNTSVMRSLTDTWGAYGSDGTRKAGPAKTADLPILGLQGKETPMFAGADGTSYAVLCDGNPLGQMKSWVVAYGMDFAEQWRIEVSPACPAGNGVMTDDGVIYLTRSSNVNVELVAVQTTSPGLAKSSWPTLRHDNQGTSWLTP